MSIICRTFVGNAWRSDLCSNCFKSLEDHSDNPPGRMSAGGHPRYVPQAPSLYQSRGISTSLKWRLSEPIYERISRRDFASQTAPKEEVRKGRGILVQGKKTRSRSNVDFSSDEALVIGYGGNDYDSDQSPWEMGSDDGSIDLDLLDDTDEDRKISRLTKNNTEFNSSNQNLLLSKESPLKGAPTPRSKSFDMDVIQDPMIRTSFLFKGSSNCNQLPKSEMTQMEDMSSSIIKIFPSNTRNYSSPYEVCHIDETVKSASMRYHPVREGVNTSNNHLYESPRENHTINAVEDKRNSINNSKNVTPSKAVGKSLSIMTYNDIQPQKNAEKKLKQFYFPSSLEPVDSYLHSSNNSNNSSNGTDKTDLNVYKHSGENEIEKNERNRTNSQELLKNEFSPLNTRTYSSILSELSNKKLISSEHSSDSDYSTCRMTAGDSTDSESFHDTEESSRMVPCSSFLHGSFSDHPTTPAVMNSLDSDKKYDGGSSTSGDVSNLSDDSDVAERRSERTPYKPRIVRSKISSGDNKSSPGTEIPSGVNNKKTPFPPNCKNMASILTSDINYMQYLGGESLESQDDVETLEQVSNEDTLSKNEKRLLERQSPLSDNSKKNSPREKRTLERSSSSPPDSIRNSPKDCRQSCEENSSKIAPKTCKAPSPPRVKMPLRSLQSNASNSFSCGELTDEEVINHCNSSKNSNSNACHNLESECLKSTPNIVDAEIRDISTKSKSNVNAGESKRRRSDEQKNIKSVSFKCDDDIIGDPIPSIPVPSVVEDDSTTKSCSSQEFDEEIRKKSNDRNVDVVSLSQTSRLDTKAGKSEKKSSRTLGVPRQLSSITPVSSLEEEGMAEPDRAPETISSRQSKLAALALELELARRDANAKGAPPIVPPAPVELRTKCLSSQGSAVEENFPTIRKGVSCASRLAQQLPDVLQDTTPSPNTPKSKKTRFSLKKLLKRNKDFSPATTGKELSPNPKAWKRQTFDRNRLSLEIVHPMDLATTTSGESTPTEEGHYGVSNHPPGRGNRARSLSALPQLPGGQDFVDLADARRTETLPSRKAGTVAERKKNRPPLVRTPSCSALPNRTSPEERHPPPKPPPPTPKSQPPPPPPPPHVKSTTTPERPPPPKIPESNSRSHNTEKLDSADLEYANLGDIRSVLIPKKPQRPSAPSCPPGEGERRPHPPSLYEEPTRQRLEEEEDPYTYLDETESSSKTTTPHGDARPVRPWSDLLTSYSALAATNYESLAEIVTTAMGEGVDLFDNGTKPLRWTDFILDTNELSLPDKQFYNATYRLREEEKLTLVVTQRKQGSAHRVQPRFPVLGSFHDHLPREFESSRLCSSPYAEWASVYVLERPASLHSVLRWTTEVGEGRAREAGVHLRDCCFVLLQLIHTLKALQAEGVEEVHCDLDRLVLVTTHEDGSKPPVFVVFPEDRVHLTTGDPRRTLCQATLDTLLHLLRISDPSELPTCRVSGEPLDQPVAHTFEVIVHALLEEKASSLSQAKSLLEYMLWGPVDVRVSSAQENDVTKNGDELQRWLDLQRAQAVKSAISQLQQPRSHGSGSRRTFDVYEEFQLVFLLQASVKSLRNVIAKL